MKIPVMPSHAGTLLGGVSQLGIIFSDSHGVPRPGEGRLAPSSGCCLCVTPLGIPASTSPHGASSLYCSTVAVLVLVVMVTHYPSSLHSVSFARCGRYVVLSSEVKTCEYTQFRFFFTPESGSWWFHWFLITALKRASPPRQESYNGKDPNIGI